MVFITTIARAAEPLPPKDEAVEPAPRLVLQISVVQLRGDLPGRFVRNMGDGGFRYLMSHGVWYADAHHAHANTETIVGHATLDTGADPLVHGMIGNPRGRSPVDQRGLNERGRMEGKRVTRN